jgi:hypothetical protein
VEEPKNPNLSQTTEGINAAGLNQPIVAANNLAPPSSTGYQAEVREWWLVEIWKDNREGFKALIEHILYFILLIGTLVLVRYIIKVAQLSHEEEQLFEKIDFYAIVIALGIFSISFIIRVIVVAFWKKKKA